MMMIGRPAVRATAQQVFPLSISGRHLVTADGEPFLLHVDTAWAIVGQLTDAQIDQYLYDRAQKGMTGVLFSAPEPFYTKQTPAYHNADGVAPFNPDTSFTNPVGAYWDRVDHTVNRAKELGMACIINPAYLGYVPSDDGWWDEINSASAEDLQAYGAWLAARYTQGNVIWCLLGDDDNAARLAKQWNIVTGMRTVRTSDIVMVHPLSDDEDASDGYTYANGLPGFNMNTVYGYESNGFHVRDLMAQIRSRPIAGGFFEGQYENADGASTAMMRRQFWGAMLGGACFVNYGNHPVWHFNSTRWIEAPNGDWQDHLNDSGLLHQVLGRQMLRGFEWWKLEARDDDTLVTSTLSSGATRLFPALASDGTFAMIYVADSRTVTIDLSEFSPSNVRVRLFDPTDGSFTLHTASTASSGSINVATGGERVIVIDEAP